MFIPNRLKGKKTHNAVLKQGCAQLGLRGKGFGAAEGWKGWTVGGTFSTQQEKQRGAGAFPTLRQPWGDMAWHERVPSRGPQQGNRPRCHRLTSRGCSEHSQPVLGPF